MQNTLANRGLDPLTVTFTVPSAPPSEASRTSSSQKNHADSARGVEWFLRQTR